MPLPPLVEPIDALSAPERARTARHGSLSAIGDEGQRRLAAAHVAIVGAGGLGSPTILALAAAGVGTITVIDDDVVDLSNLQRQIIHRHSDVGAAKVESAVRVAAELSPETRVRAIRERVTPDSAHRLLSGAHVVIDGSDTFETRAVVAAACEALGVPLVWGVVQEVHAQVTVFWSAPPSGAPPVRLSDLYPSHTVGELPTCSAVGVLGTLCLQVGALLATEAIKLVIGVGQPLLGRVLLIDALRMTQREVPLSAAASVSTATTMPPRDAATSAPAPREVSATEMLAAHEQGATLLDVREPWETATGTVAGSVTIPLADLLDRPEQAGSGPFVVICAHGIRARRAAEILRARGVHADVLAGGLAAWEKP